MESSEMFESLTVANAPPESRHALESAQRAFGVVPQALARLAVSPLALEAFESFTGLFARSSLGVLEREVVIMTVAFENECDLCMAMHSRLLRAKRAEAGLVDALRSGAPLPDARLEALRRFTLSVMAGRGHVPDGELRALTTHGFSRAQALDVVVGVAAYTLSTYANRLTRAPVDAFLADHVWRKPAASDVA